MNQIFNPLKEDHPLVTGDRACPMCNKPFHAGQRTSLLSVQAKLASTVQAVPVHARCAFKGVKTQKGVIEHVKDGDGSPYPIVTDEGEYTPEELGISS